MRTNENRLSFRATAGLLGTCPTWGNLHAGLLGTCPARGNLHAGLLGTCPAWGNLHADLFGTCPAWGNLHADLFLRLNRFLTCAFQMIRTHAIFRHSLTIPHIIIIRNIHHPMP